MQDLESRTLSVVIAADDQALADVSFFSGHTLCPTLFFSLHGCGAAGASQGFPTVS